MCNRILSDFLADLLRDLCRKNGRLYLVNLARKVYRKWELRNDLAWIVNTNKYFQACVSYRTPVRAFHFVEPRGTCVSGMI